MQTILDSADLPEGYHTLEVTVGSETETATVISAPEKIELLDDMKNGSLWGWMSQLYSIRSKGSWGVGDFEDLKTMLVEEGYLDKAALDDEAANENEIIDALYRGLKGSPCKLMAASIVDAVGEKRTQNQPGTNNEYPNWRIPLADGEGNVVPLEKLFDEPRLQEITAIMRG